MNRIDLEGRVAAVTGGAQGIGLAVAKRLAAGGAKVSIWDRDAELGASAAAELGADFRALDVRWLRQQVGFVEQEVRAREGERRHAWRARTPSGRA